MRKKRFRIFAAVFFPLFAAFVVLFAVRSYSSSFACAVSLLFFFAALIYFQLKFYREGDRKFARNNKMFLPAPRPPFFLHLKSRAHRIVWQNLEQTRGQMRYREKKDAESLKETETPAAKEKCYLGLPQEEQILFMADRSRLFFRPAALCSWTLLFLATVPARGYPPWISFALLASGLAGLLFLTTVKFPTRYYLTNFRILIRKSLPLGKTQWRAQSYPGISSFSIADRFSRKKLIIKSGKKTLVISGLSNQKTAAAAEIVRQRTCA